MTPEPQDVEALLAEVVGRAWVSRQECGSAYEVDDLIDLARSVGREFVRRSRKEQTRGKDLDRIDPRCFRDAPAATPELAVRRREWAHRMLNRLTRDQRDAVKLRHWWGMSYELVAAALELHEAAIRARVHRGLVALRRFLPFDPFPHDEP